MLCTSDWIDQGSLFEVALADESRGLGLDHISDRPSRSCGRAIKVCEDDQNLAAHRLKTRRSKNSNQMAL